MKHFLSSMTWSAALSLLLLPAVAGAYSPGNTLGGTTTTVNAGAGTQTDPNVDGNLAAYTSLVGGVSQVRYFNFLTSADQGIPTLPLSSDLLSDVSGSSVVFMRLEAANKNGVWMFNTSTNGPATELAPDPAANRSGPAIGGTTVAWQDQGFGPSTSEIVAYYDVPTGVATRVTNDARGDRNVAVSPSGSVLAWEGCDSVFTSCDIWKAVKGTSGWTSSQVTTAPEGGQLPDTNGTLIVYGSTRVASVTGADIYWTPVAGGPEVQLALAGDQRNPNISGNLVAFESRNATDATPNWDVFIYDTSTTTLYRLSNTPTLNETLNDISVVGNQVRVVFSVLETDLNVYGYTFTVAPSATVPFAAFRPHVDIDRYARPNRDEFELKATLTLGASSNGIDPLTEAVTLEVGPFSTTIPAGSFTFKPAHKRKPAFFTFQGVIDGVALDVKITPLRAKTYEFKAEGKRMNFTGTGNPVTVILTIGNDGGSATVTADFE